MQIPRPDPGPPRVRLYPGICTQSAACGDQEPGNGEKLTSPGLWTTLDGASHVPRPEGPRRPKAGGSCAEALAVEQDRLTPTDAPNLSPCSLAGSPLLPTGGLMSMLHTSAHVVS